MFLLFLFLLLFFIIIFANLFLIFLFLLFLLFLCNFYFALTQTERDENLLDMALVEGSKRHIYPLQWYRTFHGGCDRLVHHLVVRRVL